MHNSIVTIISSAPFISHNGDLANPMNPISKEMKKISSKRKKTEDDLHNLAMLEMRGGLYVNDDKLYVPGEMIEACVIGGAKLQKLGTTFKRAFRVNDLYCDFDYEGPKKVNDVVGHPDHLYQVMVKIGTSKVLRSRAIFETWSCQFSISYAEDLIDPSIVEQVLNDAGDLIGIGDRRPRYGLFQVESIRDAA